MMLSFHPIRVKFDYYHEIFIQPINLDKERSVKIPKDKLDELKSNLWIASVLIMKNMEPVIDLVPSEVFRNPDSFIFIDNEQGERFKSLSNWEIPVFAKSIPELGNMRLLI